MIDVQPLRPYFLLRPTKQEEEAYFSRFYILITEISPFSKYTGFFLEPRLLYMFFLYQKVSFDSLYSNTVLPQLKALYSLLKFKTQLEQHSKGNLFSSSNVPTPLSKTMKIVLFIVVVPCYFFPVTLNSKHIQNFHLSC